MSAGIAPGGTGRRTGTPAPDDSRSRGGTRTPGASRSPRPAGPCRGSARAGSSRAPCSARSRSRSHVTHERSGRSSGRRPACASAARATSSRCRSRRSRAVRPQACSSVRILCVRSGSAIAVDSVISIVTRADRRRPLASWPCSFSARCADHSCRGERLKPIADREPVRAPLGVLADQLRRAPSRRSPRSAPAPRRAG